jgi:4-amino-4-deoxy-L-arabinose transferase-like glycosyltransferase
MSASPPQTPPSPPPLPEPDAHRPATPSHTAPAPAPRARARLSVPALPRLRAPSREALPGWAALTPILALSAVLNTEKLSQNGFANVFYAAGVKSMVGSWHDFLFNSFDPGGLVTIDKPPLALWVQALSARLFGFAPLSLLLPQAIIGVLTVALLYAVMRRPFGRPAALVGALALAVFPAFVAVSRENGVDPLLIVLLLLACAAALRAIRTGGWPSLLACAALVGLAFNTKTLAAYLVVPGIALGYLLCARGSPPRRAVRLLAAGVVLGAVSFSWIALVESTPASQRPYVGGSTDNTEWNLTFGYNGFGRVEGQVGGPGQIFVKLGAVAPFPALSHTHTILRAHKTAAPAQVPNPLLPDGHYTNPTPFGGPTGLLRLFHTGLGGQSAWLLPFALLGTLALALSILWPPRGTPPEQEKGLKTREEGEGRNSEQHTTGQAGRAGARAADAPGRRARAEAWWGRVRRDPRTAGLLVLGGWFLVEAVVLSFSKGIVHPYYVSAMGPGSAAMVGAGAVAFARLRRARDWRVLLLAGAVAFTVAAQLVLLRREHYLHWLPTVLIAASAAGVLALLAVRRLAAPAMTLILAVLFIAPLAFATTTWSVPVEGTFPAAGPKVAGSLGRYGVTAHDIKVDRDLLRYVDAHHPTRKWEVLTVSSNTSATMILLGYRAGALGGYSGTDPAVDGPRLARMVARHEARYVVLGGAYSSRGGNAATRAVIHACRYIPSEVWLHFPRWSIYSLALYDCAGAERRLARA